MADTWKVLIPGERYLLTESGAGGTGGTTTVYYSTADAIAAGMTDPDINLTPEIIEEYGDMGYVEPPTYTPSPEPIPTVTPTPTTTPVITPTPTVEPTPYIISPTPTIIPTTTTTSTSNVFIASTPTTYKTKTPDYTTSAELKKYIASIKRVEPIKSFANYRGVQVAGTWHWIKSKGKWKFIPFADKYKPKYYTEQASLTAGRNIKKGQGYDTTPGVSVSKLKSEVARLEREEKAAKKLSTADTRVVLPKGMTTETGSTFFRVPTGKGEKEAVGFISAAVQTQAKAERKVKTEYEKQLDIYQDIEQQRQDNLLQLDVSAAKAQEPVIPKGAYRGIYAGSKYQASPWLEKKSQEQFKKETFGGDIKGVLLGIGSTATKYPIATEVLIGASILSPMAGKVALTGFTSVGTAQVQKGLIKGEISPRRAVAEQLVLTSFVGLGSGAPKKVATSISKLSPRYTAPGKTGIKFVESFTEPESLSVLRAREGLTGTTIHATQRMTPKGTIELVEGARGGKSFYQSVWDVPTGQPKAYLSYVGIKKTAASSGKVEFTIIKKPKTLTIFEDTTISKIPKRIIEAGKRGDYATVKAWELQQKTTIPTENILLRSREGQVVSPPGTVIQRTTPRGIVSKLTGARYGEEFTIVKGEKLRLVKYEKLGAGKTPKGKVAKGELISSEGVIYKSAPAELFKSLPKVSISKPSAQVSTSLYVGTSKPTSKPVSTSLTLKTFPSTVISSVKKISKATPSVISAAKPSSALTSISKVSTQPITSSTLVSKPSKTSSISQPYISTGYTPTSYTQPIYDVPSYTPPTYKTPTYQAPPYTPPTYRPPTKPPIIFRGKGKQTIPTKKGIGSFGYEVYVKRFGKYQKLKGLYARAKAIKKGEQRVRETLAASFKVKQTKKKIARAYDPNYIPSAQVFRGYKVVKGKKVKLEEEWIQRSKYRLSKRPEVTEIQIAKGKKQRTKKWL